jgi:hypothetical protein
MQYRRGAGRSGTFRPVRSVRETRREAAAIFLALVDSGRSQGTDTFITAQRNTNSPCHSSCPAREPRKLSIDRFTRGRSGIENGPVNRVLPKKFARGVLYEA